MKLLSLKLKIPIRYVITTMLICLFGWLIYDYWNTKQQLNQITNKFNTFNANYSEELFINHLKESQNIVLSATLLDLEAQILEATLEKTTQTNDNLKVNDIYKEYSAFLSKITRNNKDNLDTKTYEEKANNWGTYLLKKQFDEALNEIREQNQLLDSDFEKYLASLPTPVQNFSSGDYSYQTVDTEKGKFGVFLIKTPLSSVKVITAAANSDNCKNDCPTKSLAQHVKDNNGYAGMNGSYFCPPDYAECKDKVNSYDFALYKASSNKWLNSKALGWSDTGLATFKGTSAKFYKKSTDYGGDSVTAGISNYPTLLKDGNIVINNDKLTSYQKNNKGVRGALGVGNTNLYLALIQNATVGDAAYVMRALGAKDALNLDGGGSSAMYIDGNYVVGPGRPLPNAIVLVK